jgi:hypothetical protein
MSRPESETPDGVQNQTHTSKPEKEKTETERINNAIEKSIIVFIDSIKISKDHYDASRKANDELRRLTAEISLDTATERGAYKKLSERLEPLIFAEENKEVFTEKELNDISFAYKYHIATPFPYVGDQIIFRGDVPESAIESSKKLLIEKGLAERSKKMRIFWY